jgi:Ca2+-binding EF-hand superfamily protein
MTIHRTAVVLGLVALLGATVVAAAQEGKGAAGKGWRKGQGWATFAAVYDADKDGKVTKEELLAKHPMFDRLDTNKDGVVTEAEFDANPASQKNPNLKGWVARLDTNKDRTVSMDELNQAKTKGFDKGDKNKDGAIEESEFTPEIVDGGNA